jgi:predicted dehydrogenase
MLWMLGKPKSGIHFGTNTCTPWMDREGTSNVTLEFDSGVLGYHFGTWGARGTRMGYSFHAHCEHGLLDFKLSENKLYLRGKMSEHIPSTQEEEEEHILMDLGDAPPKPTVEEMRHFLDCVETGTTPETTPEESLEGLEVIWKLYEAEENGTIARF